MSAFSVLSTISGSEDSMQSLDSGRLQDKSNAVRSSVSVPSLLSASLLEMNSAQEQSRSMIRSRPETPPVALKPPLSMRREIESLSSQLQLESRFVYTSHTKPHLERPSSEKQDVEFGANRSNAGSLALERCLLHESLEEERARSEHSERMLEDLRVQLEMERVSKEEAYAAFIEAHHQLSSKWTKNCERCLQRDDEGERDRLMYKPPICNASDFEEQRRHDAQMAQLNMKRNEEHLRYIQDEITHAQSEMHGFESDLLALAAFHRKVGEERAAARESQREVALKTQQLLAQEEAATIERTRERAMLEGEVRRLEEESKHHRQNCLRAFFMAATRLTHVANVRARGRTTGLLRVALAGWVQVCRVFAAEPAGLVALARSSKPVTLCNRS